MEGDPCGPCQSRGKAIQLSHWCVFCEEALCPECKSNHLAMKMSKNHEGLEISKMNRPITAEQFCAKHKSLPYEYFCVDHDILGCKECLATLHRTCQNVMSVDMASKGVTKSQSFIDTVELFQQILKIIDEITGNREENKDDVEKKTEKIKKSVNTAKTTIISYLDSLEKSLLQELDQQKEQIVSRLIKTRNEAKSLKVQVQEKRDSLDIIEKHGSEKQVFLLTHQFKRDLEELEERVVSLSGQATRTDIAFTETNLKKVIENIGSLRVTETSSKIIYNPIKKRQSQFPVIPHLNVPKLEYQYNINLPYLKTFYISGMTVNDKNELIICDLIGSRLLVFDENNRYKYQIATKYILGDIAVIPGTDIVVVVTHYNEDYIHIQFVDINTLKTGSQLQVEDSNEEGIAVSAEHVYFGGKGKIHVLDHQGHPVRTIDINPADRMPCYMTLGNNGNIYYTDRYNVSCIKPDGDVVFTYTLPDPGKTSDIKTDNHDNVYFIDNPNKAIHRLRSDGTFIDILKDEGLTDPVGLCFNRNYTKLFVSDGNSISYFKMI